MFNRKEKKAEMDFILNDMMETLVYMYNEDDIKSFVESKEYTYDKKLIFCEYARKGVAPDVIKQYIYPKMEADRMRDILEVLLWDKEPYQLTDMMKDIHDKDIFDKILYAHIRGTDMTKIIPLLKNISRPKQEALLFMSSFPNIIENDINLERKLRTCDPSELSNILYNKIISENYNDIIANDGNFKRQIHLYRAVNHKKIGREKVNKYIKKEHDEHQIDALLLALIHVDNEETIEKMSNPKLTSNILYQLIEVAKNPKFKKINIDIVNMK